MVATFDRLRICRVTMSLLFHMYTPIGDVYVDVRIFGPGPLTAKHIETFIKYLAVARDALAPAEPAQSPHNPSPERG